LPFRSGSPEQRADNLFGESIPVTAFWVIEGPSRLAQKCLEFTEGKTLRAAHGSGKQLFPFSHIVTIYSYKSKIKKST
jgi:hypothetical protein